jgi:hypothetical protein
MPTMAIFDRGQLSASTPTVAYHTSPWISFLQGIEDNSLATRIHHFDNIHNPTQQESRIPHYLNSSQPGLVVDQHSFDNGCGQGIFAAFCQEKSVITTSLPSTSNPTFTDTASHFPLSLAE